MSSRYSRYHNDYGFAPYVSVASKKSKALKMIAQLKKKMDIEPVTIEGKAIAVTWWGKSWNANLERYVDFNYRLERGRSYVRHNAVLDLKIKGGEINALVQGSSSSPYNVTINIKPLASNDWNNIKNKCAGKIESLQPLLEGKFSKDLQEIFFTKDSGLFPAPKEISYKCNCLDFASMCKHISAALYGVGARLDKKPLLLFNLRNIDINELISKTVEEKTKKLLKKSQTKTSRIIADADISNVFGIEVDSHKEEKAAPETKSVAEMKNRTAATKADSKIKTKTKAPAKSNMIKKLKLKNQRL